MTDLIEELSEMNPDALVADGLDDALIGYTVNVGHPHVAVYSTSLCIETLVKHDGMTPEEAEEYLEFNTFSAYVGPNGPIFVRTA